MKVLGDAGLTMLISKIMEKLGNYMKIRIIESDEMDGYSYDKGTIYCTVIPQDELVKIEEIEE